MATVEDNMNLLQLWDISMTEEEAEEERPERKPVAVKQVVAGTPWEMFLRWVFDQSVSTVLLVSILAAILYGVPNYMLPAIRDGYKANADALERTVKLSAESRERETKLLMDLHERDRQSFERAVNVMERRP